jgi:hypothetical protein
MKCIFNSSIVCPIYEAQKELGYTPNLQEIQDKECPQCPYGPNTLKKNRVNIKPFMPSLGRYLV